MTRQPRSFVLLFCLLAGLAGCGSIPATTSEPVAAAQDGETLTQVSTYPALQMGQFDGDVTFAQLAQSGDFGLGTFDGLDGEMVALDGVFYQAKADGTVGVADKALQTPFADVHFFHSNQQVLLKEPLQNLDQLKAYLAKQLPSPNRPYGIKISGTFPMLKWRSVPRQPEPFPTLADAVAGQVVFEQQNIKATLVGYALPEYLGGVAATGYHFHYISDDKLHGGHVLDISLAEATVDIDYLESVKLLIPQNATFQQTDFTKP
jgi:acetolactate decarboxylase